MTKLRSVLVVEDNINDVILLQRMLRGFNTLIQVVSHSTGEAAIDYLTASPNPPELILLDLKLPKMSGEEFVSQVKMLRRLELIPIVVVTGFMTDIIKASNIAAGYITKPITEDEFKVLLELLRLEV